MEKAKRASARKAPKKPVTVHAAKTHLSRLLKRVEKGEEIVIARGAKPVARLVPMTPPAEAPKKRPMGLYATGKPWTDEEWAAWNAMDKEIEQDFEDAINAPFPGDETPRR
jgi:prevent-host-death family protein